MDPLEHASIPSLVYLALSGEPTLAGLTALALGAVFPDLDALAEEHRSYLHSLLPFLPVLLLGLHLGSPFLLFALGWGSHLFLDFFTGVVPPAYPLSRRGWGLSITVTGPGNFRIRAEIIERYPDERHDYRLEIGGSFALALLAILTAIIRLH
ncbi:metal-dependent hydrolase [Thermococcus henrietii]|uniref:metal-dependent hydrolase n=1 Tax=Thermococcus henrietii TaxID=2016361 RepID=UPI000C073BB9|nr:metal-dependent hydrolase [Thermococcus henrietii]